MQIIEVSVIGVRSAVITLTRRDTPMKVVFFPMIHLGTPAYYRAVMSGLSDCQLVVAEGIRGKSATTSVATLSYRLLRRNRKLGLVAQNLDLEGLGIPVIRPDMTGAQFEQRWRQAVPLLQRMLLWCVVPIYALGMLVVGSRRMLARQLALDDLPTRQQELTNDAFENMDDVVVTERDRMLLEALLSIHAAHSSEDMSVGVVYGAGHVPGVAGVLVTRLGYRPRSAKWLTVFDF
jgi:hypothetical protein